jgi:hypothetical protein
MIKIQVHLLDGKVLETESPDKETAEKDALQIAKHGFKINIDGYTVIYPVCRIDHIVFPYDDNVIT